MGRITVIGDSQSGDALREVFEGLEVAHDLRVYHTSCDYGRRGLNWHPVKSRVTQTTQVTAAGVKMPKLFTSYAAAKAFQNRTGNLVWSRNHTEEGSGAGITQHLVENADYWVQFVPSESEWRVNVGRYPGCSHCGNMPINQYVSIGCGKKNFTSREAGELDWRFTEINQPPSGLIEAATTAAKAVGYDFAGVDVLMTEEGPFVLECNKSPDVRGPYTKSWYKKFITDWASVGYRV